MLTREEAHPVQLHRSYYIGKLVPVEYFQFVAPPVAEDLFYAYFSVQHRLISTRKTSESKAGQKFSFISRRQFPTFKVNVFSGTLKSISCSFIFTGSQRTGALREEEEAVADGISAARSFLLPVV